MTPGRPWYNGCEVMAVDYGRMCPRYEAAVALLGKKWTGLLLRILMDGPKRFSDFKGQVPEVSDRLLSERLGELEAAGVVDRIVHDTKPVLIEYRLTEKGRALEPVIRAIQEWAEEWCEPPEEAGGGAGREGAGEARSKGIRQPTVEATGEPVGAAPARVTAAVTADRIGERGR